MPAAALLEEADERALLLTVQRGKRAVDECLSMILPQLQLCVAASDTAPLSGSRIVVLARQVLTRQLQSTAEAAQDAAAFAISFARLLHDALAHYVESLKRRPDGIPLNMGPWLAASIPSEELLRHLAGPCGTLFARRELLTALAEARAALDDLVQAHLRLAVPYARRAMRQPCEYGDLMNEGALILRRAAESFNLENENRFSSYAQRCLQHELKRRSPGCAGVKRHTREQLRAVEQTRMMLSSADGAPASFDEACEHLGLDAKMRIEIENARRLLAAERDGGKDGEKLLLEPADTRMQSPFSRALGNEQKKLLRAAFARLDPFEKRVLVGRCICKLSERKLASRYRRSPKTIRKAYSSALAKLERRLDPDFRDNKPR
jgi:RNA polymerase sigma factor (sigma-70 family)